MKKLLLVIALLGFGSTAHGTCYGTDTYKNCYDAQSGNNYSIQKYGNTTHVQGRNSRQGSSWNQQSTTIGNSTYHSGTDKAGTRWNHACFNGRC